TITMPPHLGQARIWPTAAGSRTRSRDLHVVQVIAKRSMPVADPIRRSRPEDDHSSGPLQNGLLAGGKSSTWYAGDAHEKGRLTAAFATIVVGGRVLPRVRIAVSRGAAGAVGARGSRGGRLRVAGVLHAVAAGSAAGAITA